MEQLLFILLLKMDMNKLFKFYWKKETQMLIFQIRFFCWLFSSFSFFLFLIFLFFLNVKGGVTPLYLAAQEGHEQIVQLLLEKGKANVDLPNQVILLLVFFFFFFFSVSHFSIFFECKGWNNSSLSGGSTRTWTNCSNFIGKRKTKCWSCKSDYFVDCFLFFFLFFHFFISLFFFNVKDGATPLFIAACEGHEQIVQFLLEKGKPNVDLPNKVLFVVCFLFLFLFFQFLIFLFFIYLKGGMTSLFIAACNGHKQIVQILLKKGKTNVDLPTKVIVLFVIILNLLILFFQSLQWKWREGGWILSDICFVFYFLKILFFLKSFLSRVGLPLFIELLRKVLNKL